MFSSDAPHSSKRAELIRPFYVMEAVRAAQELEAAGHEVLHLEVGQPSTMAPQLVREAAHKALDNDVLGYTMPHGLPKLRNAIAGWYDTNYGLDVDPGRLIVTPGASGSCAVAFLSLFDVGDRVGVIEPGYPCYRNDLAVLGIDVVNIPVGPETGYRPTPEILDAHGPLDGLVLASPSNPTGTVLSLEELSKLSTWAARSGTHLVVDEIYHGITYDQPAPTALQLDNPNITVFNSFSKYWSMTGWRLGWIVVPDGLSGPFERVLANLLISAPTLSQVGGIAAFDSIDECEANVARYAANREILLGGLPAAGIDKIAPPDGAFYVWADVEHLLEPNDCSNAQELCTRWLNETGVAATPGIDFDTVRGDHFVRFSYAGSAEHITKAVERLATWCS